MNDTIKTLSLFSGAGGLDIGFHKAGFDIVGCVEIEQQYCNTLIANRDAQRYFNPQAKIYCQDIRTFNPSEFSEMGSKRGDAKSLNRIGGEVFYSFYRSA